MASQKIRKAVIAAAGKGTRMLHLATNKPKHLIKVNNRPFLFYVLKNLKEAGIKEMILVVGHKKEAMEAFAREYRHEFSLTLVDQFKIAGTKRYGTAIPIECAKDAVGDESFIAIFGDNMYAPEDIEPLTHNDEFTYVGGLRHNHPERYGVLLTEDGYLKNIIEKPKEFVSNLINTGLAKFTPDIFDAIRYVNISPRGEYELTDAIRILAQKKKVKVKEIGHYWFDFGNPADIIRVSDFLEKHR